MVRYQHATNGEGQKMRVLLIEKNPDTSHAIEQILIYAGFTIYCTNNGCEGLELGKLYAYDIILTELDLSDIGGHEVTRQLRLARIGTPIFVVTGRDNIPDKLKAFGYGADDYLIKPFHREELVARINAIIRRSHNHPHSIIQIGKVTVNLDTKIVEVDKNVLRLTGKEYQALELLSLRRGATVTREMLLNHLYGVMDEPELKIIDVYISKLRKKLSAATGGPSYINTIWGRGYMMINQSAQVEKGLRS